MTWGTAAACACCHRSASSPCWHSRPTAELPSAASSPGQFVLEEFSSPSWIQLVLLSPISRAVLLLPESQSHRPAATSGPQQIHQRQRLPLDSLVDPTAVLGLTPIINPLFPTTHGGSPSWIKRKWYSRIFSPLAFPLTFLGRQKKAS